MEGVARVLGMTFEDDPVEEDPIEEDPIEEDPIEEDPPDEDPPDEDEPSGFEGLDEAIAAGPVVQESPLQRFLGKFRKS